MSDDARDPNLDDFSQWGATELFQLLDDIVREAIDKPDYKWQCKLYAEVFESVLDLAHMGEYSGWKTCPHCKKVAWE